MATQKTKFVYKTRWLRLIKALYDCDFAKKAEIIKEANRVLKPKGKLILLEWIPGSSMAPKEGWMISKDEAIELAKVEEIELDKELILDNQHYGLVFEK